MGNNLLNEQVKSQLEIIKEGGKCKICKKDNKGKLTGDAEVIGQILISLFEHNN